MVSGGSAKQFLVMRLSSIPCCPQAGGLAGAELALRCVPCAFIRWDGRGSVQFSLRVSDVALCVGTMEDAWQRHVDYLRH